MALKLGYDLMNQKQFDLMTPRENVSFIRQKLNILLDSPSISGL